MEDKKEALLPSAKDNEALDSTHQKTSVSGGTVGPIIQLGQGEVVVNPINKLPSLDPSFLSLEQLPSLLNFIPREEEFEYYKSRLEKDRIAVIEGFTGTGKTKLGAYLATQFGKPTLWMTFRKGVNDNVEAIIWEIAKFLFKQGEEDLWRFLDAERQTQRPQELHIKLNILAGSLEKADYLLGFDNFHIVNRNEKITSFFEFLRSGVENFSFLLIGGFFVMSRYKPRFLGDLVFKDLRGLKKQEARLLLENCGVLLEDVVFEKLFYRTEGNPQFLKLFISWVNSAQQDSLAIEQFIKLMPKRKEVKDYLLNNVYDALAKDEKDFIRSLSVIRGNFSRSLAEELVQETEDCQPRIIVEDLVGKHILEETDDGENLFFHSIIRDYLWSLLDKKQLIALNTKAGQFYHSVSYFLEASFYFFEAYEYEKAATELLENSDFLMDTGKAGSLLEQLYRFNGEIVSKETWRGILSSQGDVLERIGELKQAVEAYKKAFVLCNNSHLYAKLHRKLGWSYQRLSNYKKSKEEFQKGIEILKNDNKDSELPRLYYCLSFTLHQEGEYVQAIDSAKKALELLDLSLHPKDVAEGLNIIGIAYLSQGKPDDALKVLEQALIVNRALGQQYGIQNNLGNIGYIKLCLGELEIGEELTLESLQIAKVCGYLHSQSISYSVLAQLNLMKGNLKESETYICLALEIKKQLDNKHEIASSLNDYVVLLSVKGKYKEALSRAEEALNIYKEIGDQNGAAIATANVSNLNIQFGNLDLAYIQSADTLIEAERVEVNDLIAGLLCNIVSILIIRGELSEVVSMSNKAMGFATKSQNTMTLSLVNLTIGSCYKELGDFALAERYFTEALDKIRSDGIKCQLLMALIFLAEAYIRVGKISEAKNACLEGKKISAEFENSFSAAQFDRILGQINSAERHWQKAEKFFKKGINYFNGYGALPELAITYKELGLMFLSNGNQINAIQALESAETIFTDLGAENQVLVIRSIKNA